jgi:ABC-type nitrate/sulfonate/bicarbonate transport system ATPase subunit
VNSFLEVNNISKYFKGVADSKQLIFENLTFSISEEHDVTSILIPFGGGKTTLLKILSGIDKEYSGEILLKGGINNILPFIPANPSSYPWLSVRGNIELILTLCEKNRKQIVTKFEEIIDLIELTGYEDHFCSNKSRGFRFRISLGRALAASPQIIMLDDSLKCLDSTTRIESIAIIKKIAMKKRIKFLLASSNITEVVMLSDKVLLLRNKPSRLYAEIRIEKNQKESDVLNDTVRGIIQQQDILNTNNYSI